MEAEILQMPMGKFLIFVAFAGIFAGVSGYFAFVALRRARIIEDTPTSKIRSAAQGFVELDGIARANPDKTLQAPLTDTVCCWYRFEIEKKSDKDWKTIDRGFSEAPFLVEDETGQCVVLPKGAEVTASERSVWYGNSREPTERNPASEKVSVSAGPLRFKIDTGFGNSNSSLFSMNRYRYTEERLYAGDSLYALGYFRSLDEKDHHRARRQITAEVLKFWKNDQARLLQRFDKDGDGQIDALEWEQARQTAEQIAADKHEKMKEKQAMHVISRSPVKGYPFLLSSLPEFNLARRYRNWSRILMVVFLASGSGLIYLLTHRF